MKYYIVEVMNKADYATMMTGGHDYKIHRMVIEAETASQAYDMVIKANPDMEVNNYIRSMDEIEAERKAIEDAYAMKLAKKAQAKTERKVKRAEDKVAKLEAKLAKAKGDLEALRKG